jgi:hypothetical protein
MSRVPNAGPDSNVPQQSSFGFVVRFIWMLIGPGVAIISLLLIFQNRQGGFGKADLTLWCAVAASAVLRYIDVSRLNGLKATGERATIADSRRYTIVLVMLALVLWGAARLLG